MRTAEIYPIENADLIKKQLLDWAQQFDEVVWLDSNQFSDRYSSFEGALAVDAFTAIRTDEKQAFEKLAEYQHTTADWIFGYLSYDLKNATEELTSCNYDGPEFPELYFFQPKKLFLLKKDTLEIHYLRMVDDEIEEDLADIFTRELKEPEVVSTKKTEERPRISKQAYLSKVGELLAHIQRGEVYEANFCQEFYIEEAELSPIETFRRLNTNSRAPFAAFVKLEHLYMFSASPERYIKKTGTQIISQPIKGTARRSADPVEDLKLATELVNDQKERSENIMIVDLVRNDLSKTAARGSVSVEELCAVYSFKQVHQLISTVKSTLAPGVNGTEVLRSTYPMGSMTGAPKISAMKIIEELEESKRGLYSGALGYFTPKADFDFSVVIRSILYNQKKRYASFSVGGAITAQSVPEREYEECLLKAKAMREALG